MEPYRLTICCVTYNHKKYISQALESFVSQETHFRFQVLVGDDASTDGTTDIVNQYAKKYPEIIKPIIHKKNVGPFLNSLSLYQAARTQYVSICDGDDYFIDTKKLQKQVDFLDAHPDYSVCFHPVRVFYENQDREDEIYPSDNIISKVHNLSISDLLKCNFMQTNSIVFRWRFRDEDIRKFLSHEIAPGDYYLNLLHAQMGKIGFLPDVMSVYRRNDGGIWTGAGESVDWLLRFCIPYLAFMKKKQTEFLQEDNHEFQMNFLRAVAVALKNDRGDVLRNLDSCFPSEYEKISGMLSSYSFLKYIYYSMLSICCFGKKRWLFKRIKRIFRYYLFGSSVIPSI